MKKLDKKYLLECFDKAWSKNERENKIKCLRMAKNEGMLNFKRKKK